MERRILIISVLKNIVDVNFKFVVNGVKWSFIIVRRVCGMDIFKRNSNSSEEESLVLKFLMRLYLCIGRGRDFSLGEDIRFLLVFL